LYITTALDELINKLTNKDTKQGEGCEDRH
jgi:hypothetical protein